MEPVDLSGDNEPSLVAGLVPCTRIKTNIGLGKKPIAIEERMIPTMKNLSNTLIAQLPKVEISIQRPLPGVHLLQVTRDGPCSVDLQQISCSYNNGSRSIPSTPYREKATLFGQAVLYLSPFGQQN